MNFTSDEVQAVCRLVNELTGIQWDADKTYLIESRFGKLMHEHRIESLTDLVLKVNSSGSVRTGFIDSVTTRETLFFRDNGPFNALQHKALPEILDIKSETPHPRRLRIWSAACSSGQEPYSIGIVLRELLEDIDEWDIKILATDLSPAALSTASLGVYSDFEMSRGVPENLRNRYFSKVADGWRICDEVRSLVSFESRNLLEPFTNMGPYDVIFCRNVAIYFDEPVKRDLFERLAGVLAPHGSIFIGSSETLNSLRGDRWKPQYHCRGTFYQPNRSTAYTPSRAAIKPLVSTKSTASLPKKTVACKPTAEAIPNRTIPTSVVATPRTTTIAVRKTTALATIKTEKVPVRTGTPARIAATTTKPPLSKSRPATSLPRTTSSRLSEKPSPPPVVPTAKNPRGATQLARTTTTAITARRNGLSAINRPLSSMTTCPKSSLPTSTRPKVSGPTTSLTKPPTSFTSRSQLSKTTPTISQRPGLTANRATSQPVKANLRTTTATKSATPIDDLLATISQKTRSTPPLGATGSCNQISRTHLQSTSTLLALPQR